MCNLSMFSMITEINQSKKLTKHISCESKCRFDGTKSNSNQWWYNEKCRCEYIRRHVCETDYVWNPVRCNCENGKYSARDNSAIICDEVIESYDEKIKTILKNFNEKEVTCKMQNFYILHAFFLNYYSIIDSC